MLQRGRSSVSYCRPTVRSTATPGDCRASAAASSSARPYFSGPSAALTHSGDADAQSVNVGSAPTQVGAGMLSVSTGALVAARPRTCVFRVTLPAGELEEGLLFGVTARGTGLDAGGLDAGPAEIAFTLVEGARNNRQPRDEAAAMAVAIAWHSEILRAAARMNRSGERRQARSYVEREFQYFERYCAGLLAALPLLREIAVLKQNVDREWDERTRKEMEVAAYTNQTNRADYRGARKSWSDRLNDGS